MSDQKKFKFLFLCTGNSARSILGEYLLRHLDPKRFEVYSAGSNPKGDVHPMAIKVLKEMYGIDTSDARSKNLSEFKDNHMDFVVTVCDNARENCPIWPGEPVIAHWSSPDPAAFEGTDEEKERFFFKVAQQIKRRLELFIALPFDKLDELRIEAQTKSIGDQAKMESEATTA